MAATRPPFHVVSLVAQLYNAVDLRAFKPAPSLFRCQNSSSAQRLVLPSRVLRGLAVPDFSHLGDFGQRLPSQSSLAPSTPALRVHSYGALPAPLRSDLGLSQTLAGFLLAAPRGLVSCLRHPWGPTLQGFPLSREPHRVPTAVALMAFVRLQGLAPPEKSVACAGCLRRQQARFPPGLRPLQGIHASRRSNARHVASSHDLRERASL